MKKQQNDRQTSGNSAPAPNQGTEKDADDLVHAREQKLPQEIGEEDPDDIVHQPNQQPPASIEGDSLEDPDDVVHGQQTDDEP